MPRILDLPKVEAVLKDSTGKIDFVVVRFENYKKFVRKCDIEGTIDEPDYLSRYKDVQKAISEGKCRTATEHYLNTGYVEQRSAKLVVQDTPNAGTHAAEEARTQEPAQEEAEADTEQEDKAWQPRSFDSRSPRRPMARPRTR